jgi:hypothetical protein
MAPALSWWFRAFIVFMAVKRAGRRNLQLNRHCPPNHNRGNCQLLRFLDASFCLFWPGFVLCRLRA